MRCFLVFLLFLSASCPAFAQHRLLVKVAAAADGQPVAGATLQLRPGNRNATADDSGDIRFADLPAGIYEGRITAAGFSAQSFAVTVPDSATRTVLLQAAEKALEEVTIISTTRNNQRIENSPLKVEVLGKEEMDEENTIRPANIASILGDVSGIQIQQSSAVSGNANVRIQGLEGRYTQILRDGMPLFEGFAGGFGILTIPPLDLRQIELVKGSASTLYGGGAIGGLINLISRRPGTKQEAVITLNATTLQEFNLNAYAAHRQGKWGYSLFGGATRQAAVDVNEDGFSDLPRLKALILHPRLFFYPDAHNTILAGYTGSWEDRYGGDMTVLGGVKGGQHQFFERNNNGRHTGELQWERSLTSGARLTVKGSYSAFDREITTDQHFFSGRQQNYFSEASLFLPAKNWDWVMGVNAVGDAFRIGPSDPVYLQDFSNHTLGLFVQHTWRLPDQTVLESGIRADRHNDYGVFLLPRLALFHRFDAHWATRLGFGMGYKTPNALAPQNTEYAIEQLLPIIPGTKAELSYGYNAEVNYKWNFEDGSLFINQAFFLTRLTRPLVGVEAGNGTVQFRNQEEPLTSKGFDTYVQLRLDEWDIYAGYTYTIARREWLPGENFVPLTPRNRFAFTLVNEIEGKWRFGLEGSYTGRQHRDSAGQTPGYFFLAAMVQRDFGPRLSLILNGENLLDYRQSREEALFDGPVSAPRFRPLWAPIDGRVLNLSLRVKVFE